ncbi:FGGY family of carbohydrate kinase [Striga asiatica]|uniref:FGGY family of carbohydrate kinase n=1 Tax=Striga asiatica TaxID=4170 RepID=A0A5A7QTQ2_STRAF|nr:FGGY family of carbohydrate kinase [Striga asiatica]
MASKTRLALLLPILAVLFARFSFPISVSLLLILLSVTPLVFKSSNRTLKTAIENNSSSDENTLTTTASIDDDTKTQEKPRGDENEPGLSSDDKFSSEEEQLSEEEGPISDEEGLIEIAIPSGHFVPEKDGPPMFLDDLSCSKLLSAEEDNLIEIDIYMGSIKCSKFDM